MRVRLLVATFLLALLVCAPGFAEPDRTPPEDVDLVLVLDTSASMEALIEAARDKLSRVITAIATADPEPDLRLALVTYGGPEVAGGVQGNVILQSNLTFDFDAVFDRLDDATESIQGGHEYVGTALYVALTRVTWTPGSLRIVFVAGNESADQDREIRMPEAAKRLADRGVRINAIYCGGESDGVSDTWRALAEGGNGRFASIDHNQGTVTVASPFDKELASLSKRLSRTYLFGGVDRKTAAERLARVDVRAEAIGTVCAAERAIAKATSLFRPVGDVVGAAARGLDLRALTGGVWPEPLAELSADARDARLEALRSEREALAMRVREVAAKRRTYVRKAMRTQGLDDRLAFDRAVRDALREQMIEAGFRFE